MQNDEPEQTLVELSKKIAELRMEEHTQSTRLAELEIDKKNLQGKLQLQNQKVESAAKSATTYAGHKTQPSNATGGFRPAVFLNNSRMSGNAEKQLNTEKVEASKISQRLASAAQEHQRISDALCNIRNEMIIVESLISINLRNRDFNLLLDKYDEFRAQYGDSEADTFGPKIKPLDQIMKDANVDLMLLQQTRQTIDEISHEISAFMQAKNTRRPPGL